MYFELSCSIFFAHLASLLSMFRSSTQLANEFCEKITNLRKISLNKKALSAANLASISVSVSGSLICFAFLGGPSASTSAVNNSPLTSNHNHGGTSGANQQLMTADAFAATKFGSTKLKSRKSNINLSQMSPTQFEVSTLLTN